VLRWLILIPFALLVALGTGLVALLVATVMSPQLTLLIGGGFEYLLAALVDQIESGFDPGPTAQGAFALVGRLGFAILVAPLLLVALGSEIFRLRSGLIQTGLTGLLAALLPLAMLGLTRTPTLAEMQVVSALFLIGAATGFAYWLIAGRGAGGEAAERLERP
jgi:hypothetical protein